MLSCDSSCPAGALAADAPSPWVLRFAPLIPPASSVLDLACGAGRHTHLLAARGHAVEACDRDAQALDGLREIAHVNRVDLETAPWPYAERQFGGVVVTRYLWRALLPKLVEAVAPGGILIYETFAEGQASLGRPRNPDFLLRPGELLDVVRPRLRVIAFEDGFIEAPQAAFVQRICAVREAGAGHTTQSVPKYNL